MDAFDESQISFFQKIFIYQIFDIVSAQIYEYNSAVLIDKPLEALTGFIHILPGAYCAYRWLALNGPTRP
jgi:cellulose synthase/poly-beta-1,6-N-acetylglucosamine synthase-like glycosyltransferase